MGRSGQIKERIEKWIREEEPDLMAYKSTELQLMFDEWCELKQLKKPTYVSFHNNLKFFKDEIKAKGSKAKNKTKSTKRSFKVTLEEKEDDVRVNLDIVANGFSNGMIISGPTGIGKTTAVISRLKEFNIKYEEFSGAISSPLQLYLYLYLHRHDKVLVIDDTSGLIGTNDSCGNIISAALDDNKEKENYISFLHKELKDPKEIERIKDEEKKRQAIPNRFKITSRMIFITNTEMSKISKAIASRCFPLDYWLTRDEILWKIEKNLKEIHPDANMRMKKEVLDFFKEKKDVWNRFDIRSFNQACLYRIADALRGEPGQWKRRTEKAVNSGA